MKSAAIAFFSLFIGLSTTAHATALHPHTDIVNRVTSWLEQQSEGLGQDSNVKVHAPDPRIRLAACETNMEIFIANGVVRPGPQTVGVRCHQAAPWTLYLAAHIRVFADIAITRHALPRGHVLSSNDFDLQRRDVSSLKQNYLTDLQPHMGKVTRRPVREGQVLNARLLEEKKLVERGDTVQIEAVSKHFSIKMTGIALEHGRKNERIEIRNVQSKRIVEAQVVKPGVVRVSL